MMIRAAGFAGMLCCVVQSLAAGAATERRRSRCRYHTAMGPGDIGSSRFGCWNVTAVLMKTKETAPNPGGILPV